MMNIKVVNAMISAYSTFSLVLMASCLCIFIWACLEKALYGEFGILPILNMAQFKNSGVLDEEGSAMLERAVEYLDYLEMNGHGIDDPLWLFANICTTVALCNIPFLYLLRLFKANCSRWVYKVLIISSGLALILISAVRIYTDNCYGSFDIELRYPIAYITWRELVIPIFALLILTGIAKLIRFEEKA